MDKDFGYHVWRKQMKLIFKIYKKIRQAQNRDKHRFEMYKLGVSSTIKQMQMELEIAKREVNEKDAELQVAKKELSKFEQINIDFLQEIKEEAWKIRSFMRDNWEHLELHPDKKNNFGFSHENDAYTDPKENLAVNNKLREIGHYVHENEVFKYFRALYCYLADAYREIVRYEMRVDSMNAQQVAINDQILKLGIVKGVNDVKEVDVEPK